MDTYNVDVLIKRHAKGLQAMREHKELRKSLGADEHDDLFLLRHFLSANGSVSRAATAAVQCIRWRQENAELLDQAEELHHRVKEILPVGMLPFHTSKEELVQIYMPFEVDAQEWAKASLDWHFRSGVANREVAYRICDRLTRERRRLTKVILIQDLSGLSWSIVYSQYRLTSVQGRLSKISAFAYPQVRGAGVPHSRRAISSPKPLPFPTAPCAALGRRGRGQCTVVHQCHREDHVAHPLQEGDG